MRETILQDFLDSCVAKINDHIPRNDKHLAAEGMHMGEDMLIKSLFLQNPKIPMNEWVGDQGGGNPGIQHK